MMLEYLYAWIPEVSNCVRFDAWNIPPELFLLWKFTPHIIGLKYREAQNGRPTAFLQ